MPSDAKTHQPTEPLDLPVDVGPSPGGATPAAPGAAPASPRAPATTPPTRRRRTTSMNSSEAAPQPAARFAVPLVLNPGSRNVPLSATGDLDSNARDAVERVE
jgi:hypothetical protein